MKDDAAMNITAINDNANMRQLKLSVSDSMDTDTLSAVIDGVLELEIKLTDLINRPISNTQYGNDAARVMDNIGLVISDVGADAYELLMQRIAKEPISDVRDRTIQSVCNWQAACGEWTEQIKSAEWEQALTTWRKRSAQREPADQLTSHQ